MLATRVFTLTGFSPVLPQGGGCCSGAEQELQVAGVARRREVFFDQRQGMDNKRCFPDTIRGGESASEGAVREEVLL